MDAIIKIIRRTLRSETFVAANDGFAIRRGGGT